MANIVAGNCSWVVNIFIGFMTSATSQYSYRSFQNSVEALWFMHCSLGCQGSYVRTPPSHILPRRWSGRVDVCILCVWMLGGTFRTAHALWLPV